MFFSLNLSETAGPLSSQTTARTHFQSWSAAPAHPYAELPPIAGLSFFFFYSSTLNEEKRILFKLFFSLFFSSPLKKTGHVLFPGPQRQFSTSTGSTFVPFANASKARPIARPEINGSLRISGRTKTKTATNKNKSFFSRSSLRFDGFANELSTRFCST